MSRAAIMAAMILAGASLPAAASPSPETVAEAALRNAPVFDGHNDVPEQLRDRYRNVIDGFDFRDTRAAVAAPDGTIGMHTDLARLRRGRVGAQFWSVYVSADLAEP